MHQQLVYRGVSPYQNIYVFDRNRFDEMSGRFRILQFTANAVQGVKDMDNPSHLVLPFSRIVVDLIDHYASDFQKGFIIGHGIGAISSYYSNKNMLTVEIDPLVVEVSKKYFGYMGNNIEIGDGRELLEKQVNESQDIIFLDAYNGSSIPFHLTTQEFFVVTKDKLTSDGILVINYLGRTRGDDLLRELFATVSSVYPYVKVFAAKPEMQILQNIFFVASQQALENYSPNEASPIQVIGGNVLND
jgi:spermidine synthase